MIHYTVLMDALSTARYLPSTHINPHPLIGISINPHRFKEIDCPLQVIFKVWTLHGFDKAEIDIPFIMIDRTTTRETTSQRNTILPEILFIDLCLYTLMFPYHHRRRRLPKHEKVIPFLFQKIFLCCQMKMDIRTTVVYAEHYAKSVSWKISPTVGCGNTLFWNSSTV